MTPRHVWVALALDPHDQDIMWIAAGMTRDSARAALRDKMRRTYESLTMDGGSDSDFVAWSMDYEALEPEQVEVAP